MDVAGECLLYHEPMIRVSHGYMPDARIHTIRPREVLMRKIVLPLFVFIAIVLSACAPAATPTPEVVVELTQAPTQEPTVVVPTLAPTQEPTEAQSGMMSLLDTIKADERLSLFYEALALSGVGDILEGKGPFTVFAPTNDAINAVPTLNSMEGYGKIIYNHVIPGKFMAADLIPSPGKLMNIAFTATDGTIMITVKDDVVYLNNTAMVITADIETANGVLHVIDTVLLPPAE